MRKVRQDHCLSTLTCQAAKRSKHDFTSNATDSFWFDISSNEDMQGDLEIMDAGVSLIDSGGNAHAACVCQQIYGAGQCDCSTRRLCSYPALQRASECDGHDHVGGPSSSAGRVRSQLRCSGRDILLWCQARCLHCWQQPEGAPCTLHYTGAILQILASVPGTSRLLPNTVAPDWQYVQHGFPLQS